jgi:hypothetical protein
MPLPAHPRVVRPMEGRKGGREMAARAGRRRFTGEGFQQCVTFPPASGESEEGSGLG